MFAGLCERKFCWNNDERGASDVFIKTSVSRMAHAGVGTPLRRCANVMTSSGLVENRKKKTDDNIISVSVCLSVSARRKAV